jgi:2-polyprenyl-6-methoxyphenol hydroxylase-like FAD-dependent oxidoreductase
MLANELGRRGVGVLLVDEKPSTAFNPQANATQARTMEHFRRLGFAEEIRALGLPPDFPTDIAYFTRFARHELARFALPSSHDARTKVSGLTGSWSAAELPHRVSQKFVEAVLRRRAEKLPGVSVRYGWRLIDFEETEDAVRCEIERVVDGQRRRVRCRYLFGADGPRSFVRERLGFGYVGESGVIRDFMGGRMYALYVRCPDFYELVPHAPAWMNVTFNPERRAFMAAVDGRGEFAFHTQLRPHEEAETLTECNARRMFQAAVGAPIGVEILSRGTWTAGHALVADRFQRGRVLLGGDAVHLFTPAGGLGYNTAVDDAVNVGWKLAAVLKGLADASLLESYEKERRPLAVRNTRFARAFADSLGLFVPAREIEDDTPEGVEARRAAGAYFAAHARAEFNIPGVTLGGRYDGSPIIVPDGTVPPADAANTYTPTACPGGRAPHFWLADGRSLYDTFGFEWTLLRLRRDSPVAEDIADAAHSLGLDLKVVDVDRDDARALYEADAVLIRPDQIVAWRGTAPCDALPVVARVPSAGRLHLAARQTLSNVAAHRTHGAAMRAEEPGLAAADRQLQSGKLSSRHSEQQ